MIEIRLARPGDWRGAATVHVEGWRYAYAGVFPDEFLAGLTPEGHSGWRERLYRTGRPDARFLVAACRGEIVGFCDVGPSRGQAPDVTGELYAIYVSPGVVRTGVGRLLITAGRRQLMLLGHRRAELWVLDTNERARHFYERDGWQLAGGKKDVLAGTEVTEVRYVRDLQPRKE